MQNPFTTPPNPTETSDETLVRDALAGNRRALDQLIRRHQPFIYNVAWKMVHDPNDALDLTQETLLKVVTKLSQFSGKSSFRTWLYRIVTNEFLMAKRRTTEASFSSFEEYGARLDAVPNPELTREEEIEQEELSEEMRVRCMSGMLMCLTREQRLIYVLGDSFGIDHRTGAEIFEISPQNFRVKLHRARRDLYNYMNNKCGLVNTANPCRCPRKAKALERLGVLKHEERTFTADYRARIADYVQEHESDARELFEQKYTRLFRSHPAKRDFDTKTIVEEVIENDDFLEIFERKL